MVTAHYTVTPPPQIHYDTGEHIQIGVEAEVEMRIWRWTSNGWVRHATLNQPRSRVVTGVRSIINYTMRVPNGKHFKTSIWVRAHLLDGSRMPTQWMKDPGPTYQRYVRWGYFTHFLDQTSKGYCST